LSVVEMLRTSNGTITTVCPIWSRISRRLILGSHRNRTPITVRSEPMTKTPHTARWICAASRCCATIFDRLNAVAAAAGEPIELTSTHLRRFANTFLHKIASGSNFAKNVQGDPVDGDDPVDKYNFACDGWMNLAVADVRVYDKCHEVSL